MTLIAELRSTGIAIVVAEHIVKAVMAASGLDTIAGHMVFRDDGTGIVSSPILQTINGRQVVVWPEEISTAEFDFPAPPMADR